MDIIGESFRDRCKKANLTHLENEIRKCILRTFARTGNPPTVKEIFETLTVPSEKSVKLAIGKLQRADILTTKAGVITTAYPFSADKTRHTVVFADGHSVNALCAIDALGIHFMMGEDITIHSLCPECNHEITLVLKKGKIASQTPSGVIEYVKVRNSCGCTTKTSCPHINFFCGTDHLEQWKARNPSSSDGEEFTVEEALEDGRMIFGDYLT